MPPKPPVDECTFNILWTQRIGKEDKINAKSHAEFSVRAVIQQEAVPQRFKPGHCQPHLPVKAFDTREVGWEPGGRSANQFKRGLTFQRCGATDRYQFPETSYQDHGWPQCKSNKPAQERGEPSGARPSHMGTGWIMKDGHGGPTSQLVAKMADQEHPATSWEPDLPRQRKSKDGNVRESLGVPPYGCSMPTANWGPPPKTGGSAKGSSVGDAKEIAEARYASDVLHTRQHAGKIMMDPKEGRWKRVTQPAPAEALSKSRSMPKLDHATRLADQEKMVADAMDRSRHFLNRNPNYKWYAPLGNSDVAKFADEYGKTWGCQLYGRVQPCR